MAPNNVLILGPPKSGKVRLAQFISDDYDTETIQETSHSGLIYNCDLATKYFQVNINLLVDEYPGSREDADKELVESLQEWLTEFSSEEMLELREALDGVVFTIAMETLASDSMGKFMDVATQIKELLHEEAFFVVGGSADREMDALKVEEIEDEVISSGFEFVNLQESGSNEYREKLGRDRVLEIFHSHTWSDMEKTSQPEEVFVSHKHDKLAGMSQGLLEVEEEQDLPEKELDLERILQKLRIDKEKVDTLKEDEKRDYVDKLVEEYLEYF